MKNWYWKTFFIVLAMTVILWTIAISAARYFNFYITPDNAVITVIGIVAAFIVIGNYAQVHEIKAELDEKIAEVKKELKEKQANSQQPQAPPAVNTEIPENEIKESDKEPKEEEIEENNKNKKKNRKR